MCTRTYRRYICGKKTRGPWHACAGQWAISVLPPPGSLQSNSSYQTGLQASYSHRAVLLPQDQSHSSEDWKWNRKVKMCLPPPLEILKTVFRIESGHLSPKALIHDQSAAHLPRKTMKSCRASVPLPPWDSN